MNIRDLINEVHQVKDEYREEFDLPDGDQEAANASFKRLFETFWKSIQEESDWSKFKAMGYYIISKDKSDEGEEGYRIQKVQTGFLSAELMGALSMLMENEMNQIPEDILKIMFLMAQTRLQAGNE